MVTSAGSSTTRYFDKHDLKKLFQLNPAGQCDFLDKLQEKGLLFGDFGISKDDYEGIVGLSDHARVYSKDAIDRLTGTKENDDSKENPFTSPTKFNKNPNSLFSSPEHLIPGTKTTAVLGKSQRVMASADDEVEILPNKPQTNLILGSSNDPNTMKSNASNSNTSFVVQKALTKVDGFVAMGKREKAMGVLMDTMDEAYENMDNAQKMQVHGKMSSIAHELRWL